MVGPPPVSPSSPGASISPGDLPSPDGGSKVLNTLGVKYPLTDAKQFGMTWHTQVRGTVNVRKISSGGDKQDRMLIFQSPTLLLMKNNGKDPRLTRLLHLTEISEIQVSPTQIMFKATAASNTRDWLFEINSAARNQPHDKDTLIEMIKEFSEVYRPEAIPVRQVAVCSSSNLKKRSGEKPLKDRIKDRPAPRPDILEEARREKDSQQSSEPRNNDVFLPNPQAQLPPNPEPVVQPTAPGVPIDAERSETFHIFPGQSQNNPGTAELGFAPGSSEDKPPRVKHVREEGPAASAGMWRDINYPCPIITHVNGNHVPDMPTFYKEIAESKKQTVIKITIEPGSDDISSTDWSEDEEEPESGSDNQWAPAPISAADMQAAPGSTPMQGPSTSPMPPIISPKKPHEEFLERPLVPPRRREGRRKPERFWRDFVDSYDAQMQHWGRIEHGVMQGISKRVDTRVVPLDFEGHAVLGQLPMKHTPPRQPHVPPSRFHRREYLGSVTPERFSPDSTISSLNSSVEAVPMRRTLGRGRRMGGGGLARLPAGRGRGDDVVCFFLGSFLFVEENVFSGFCDIWCSFNGLL